MKNFYALLLALVLLPVFVTIRRAFGMHDHPVAAEKVGSLTFPVSCSKHAQEALDHGLAMFHSFLFDDAENQFEAALKADPDCMMAVWAEAIGLYRPLAYQPSDADMKRGWELVQQADELPTKTQRETDYLEAAEVLYRPDARDYTTRNHEYSASLEKIYKAYPDDAEAAVFYALSLLTFDDSGHPVKDREKAIAILNPIFAAYPDHPGVAHYLIHAADNPQLAQQGLAAARRYAEIAPAAPHALHMPSHIFARLGLWREDIDSNLASLRAAQSPTAVHIGAENQLHAMEFLEYAYLQIGEDDKAKAMIGAQRKISYDQVDPNLHDYVNRTLANSAALYALETGDWKAAEALKPDLEAEPYNRAITFWAQAVAAGHLRDLAAVQHAVNEYDAMTEATKKGPKPRIAENMTTRHDEARAWLLLLQGKGEEATQLLRKLADEQDVEGKGEVETPAREMLADMLMQLNRPTEALAEYEKSIEIDPNRFNGLYGAGRAAELLGELERERNYYAHLVQNCAVVKSLRSQSPAAKTPGSKSQRPELIHAAEVMNAVR
jgi:tetratricopeptide (TPR) repeat protein